MNKEQIIIGNRLIIDFLGLRIDTHPQDGDEWMVDAANPKSIYHNEPVAYASFESSWDWLMPVVKKCHEIEYEKRAEFRDYKDLDDPKGWRAWSYRHIDLSTDILKVWTSVVRFIQWYNNPSTPNT